MSDEGGHEEQIIGLEKELASAKAAIKEMTATVDAVKAEANKLRGELTRVNLAHAQASAEQTLSLDSLRAENAALKAQLLDATSAIEEARSKAVVA